MTISAYSATAHKKRAKTDLWASSDTTNVEKEYGRGMYRLYRNWQLICYALDAKQSLLVRVCHKAQFRVQSCLHFTCWHWGLFFPSITFYFTDLHMTCRFIWLCE